MRYVLHPGFVISKSDGQAHFISAPMLAKLYGAPMNLCVVCESTSPCDFEWREDDIDLFPDHDGLYETVTNHLTDHLAPDETEKGGEGE